MSVKTLKLLLIVFVVLLFSGCAEKEIIYKDVPIEVKVPTKCIVPEVHCDFNKQTDTEVITSLRMCIKELQQAINTCK